MLENKKKGGFASGIGFVLAAAGSAVIYRLRAFHRFLHYDLRILFR